MAGFPEAERNGLESRKGCSPSATKCSFWVRLFTISQLREGATANQNLPAAFSGVGVSPE